MSGLGGRIAAQARRFGSIPWSVFMEEALYDPDAGFYQSGGAAGRGGDFVTSPEIGRVFADVWARALDEQWDRLGRPDPFVVVEAAAGSGTLARDIVAARPRCAPALRYVLVERSAALREAQVGRLPLELPAFVLGPAVAGAEPDDDSDRSVPGTGPLVTSLADLPTIGAPGVVIANELLDNLPVDLLEWALGRWHEVRVAAAGDGSDRLVEVLVPAPTEVAATADRLAGSRPEDGARIPLQRAAAGWLRRALGAVREGRLVVIDYAATTDVLAASRWTSWLRTFRRHQPGLFPLESPGSQDITCVVAVDQLGAVRPPAENRSQTAWLAAHGLDELVAAARDTWRDRAAIGDLAAMVARSRVHEASALSDPEGLGGFRVLEWEIRA